MKGKLPILGKTSKAPAILSVLGSKDWKFILEIPHDEWEGLAADQQEALLDHLLCYISGEEDEKSGDMKYSLTSPDISYFSEEVSRRGHWRPNFLGAAEEEGTDNSGVSDLLEDSRSSGPSSSALRSSSVPIGTLLLHVPSGIRSQSLLLDRLSCKRLPNTRMQSLLKPHHD